jgi:hypothetical protein
MALGHGLSLGGMAQDEDGRMALAVSSAIDLVALVSKPSELSKLSAPMPGKPTHRPSRGWCRPSEAGSA